MSTYSPAVSNMPSISRRFRPLSMTCVSPRERGFPSLVGTSRNELSSKACIDLLQLGVGASLDVAIERAAVRVDADGERAEVLDSELPQALGHELLPGDLLDLLDLGRVERLIRETALAANCAYAVLGAEALREAHHARARGRADAELLVAAGAELAHARRGVQEKCAGEIHWRVDSPVQDTGPR